MRKKLEKKKKKGDSKKRKGEKKGKKENGSIGVILKEILSESIKEFQEKTKTKRVEMLNLKRFHNLIYDELELEIKNGYAIQTTFWAKELRILRKSFQNILE